ncbi:SGNH hydrolase [Cucurbitaria berberidis CBS 394.84]|uniref:SGNH hydrolase n=1 Tax=Cucurbitaria berberidis CBS 394.84 TaxID=1168544 RepID=A0A9P4GTN2_9PLEO|nr:SGNH hydrolase [Cucurbitaria berberidis CBS 394.84]KAF1851127.1 SGNH hydrolase [Cucurbitaria berberidis CBS 394.84]
MIPLSNAAQIPLGSAVKFPWIQRFASVGDSYSAGLGSGDRLDWSCSRYTQSYPNILHTSLLSNNPNLTHQFLSCSGATSTEILEKQVPALENELDLLTISAGGNDIGLGPILSSCVYQFYMSTEDACQKSMDEARDRIVNETQLYKNVTTLIEATRHNMNQQHGIIYYTGYTAFFGTGDEICDNVTWAVWRSLEYSKQYLTLSMRKELNAMVRSVNAIIRKAVLAAGRNVRFIDYDSQIEAVRGRYCESGVLEPDPNRHGLAFYEWNTVDSGENKTELQNRTGGDVPKGSFQGNIGEQINKTLGEHPEWEFDPHKGFINRTKGAVGEEGIIEDTVHWLLPDSYKRVFHLRPEGHNIVARMLIEDLEKNGPGIPIDMDEMDEV